MAGLPPELEHTLAADFRRYHLRAQAQRLIGGTLSAFFVQVLTGGLTRWNLKALVAAAVGAAWVTARAQWPALPWALIARRVPVVANAMAAGLTADPPAGQTANPATGPTADPATGPTADPTPDRSAHSSSDPRA